MGLTPGEEGEDARMKMDRTNTVTGKKEIDLLDYWRIILKRKWVIVTVTAVLLAASGVISFSTTPLFEASATILIEDLGSGMLTIQDLFNSTAGLNSDWQGFYFNTQLRILQSRRLAERVAKKLNLAERAELKDPRAGRRSLIQMVKSVLSFRWLRGRKTEAAAPETPAAPPADGSAAYAGIVLGGLRITPITETRLVSLSFVSPFPRLAADVVNAVAKEYIDFSIESRSEATRQTSDFLAKQISDLRDDLAKKEAALQKYGDQKKIVTLSDKDNSALAEFTQLNAAYGDAQVAAVNAEINYRQMRNLRVDALPQFINNPTIQVLRTTLVQLQSDYADKSRILGSNNPALIAVKAKMDTAVSQLETEIRKAVDAARSDLEASQNKVASLRNRLDEKRTEISGMNRDSILFKTLDSEITQKRQLVSTLQAKEEETGISARLSGMGTSNIKIVDTALIPEIPVSPNVRRNLLVALLLGLICGIGLAFIADFLDSSVEGPEDIERLTGLPMLGVVPHFSSNKTKKNGTYTSVYGNLYGDTPGENVSELAKISQVELINHLFPKIAIAEDYRMIRSAILFAKDDSASRTLVFTSTSPEDGKSSVVANMAVSFAQLGERVLAIDADLRKPRQHKIFQVGNRGGLSNHLAGRVELKDAIQKTAIDNLWIIPSGPCPPNPAELLNSRKMRELMGILKNHFQMILIDTSPALVVIDPVIVSSVADGTVLVVRDAKINRHGLLKTIKDLRIAKAVIVGIIINDVKARRVGRSSSYFRYEYYGDKSVGEAAPDKGGKGRARP
jgi:capsular exopolysaccharide synthesis family protein